MKKIMLFAIMALFIGGLSVNAHAQGNKSDAKLEKELSEYKTTVEKCYTIKSNMLKAEGRELEALKRDYKSNYFSASNMKAALSQKINRSTPEPIVKEFNSINERFAKLPVPQKSSPTFNANGNNSANSNVDEQRPKDKTFNAPTGPKNTSKKSVGSKPTTKKPQNGDKAK